MSPDRPDRTAGVSSGPARQGHSPGPPTASEVGRGDQKGRAREGGDLVPSCQYLQDGSERSRRWYALMVFCTILSDSLNPSALTLWLPCSCRREIARVRSQGPQSLRRVDIPVNCVRTYGTSISGLEVCIHLTRCGLRSGCTTLDCSMLCDGGKAGGYDQGRIPWFKLVI